MLPGESHDEDLWLVMHRDLRQVARIRVVTEFLVRELRKLGPRLSGQASRRAAT